MQRTVVVRRPSRLALLLVATAIGAAGCNRDQAASTPPLGALPLTTADTPAAAPAPGLSALPTAAPARIARLRRPEDGYAYLERAYGQAQAYADAPPDYAVDYQGERPWFWRGGDGSERIAERTAHGDRYYYYEPGASQPYLVQDPDYSYAYSNGQLVGMYDPDGGVAPYDVVQRHVDPAGRYLAWAAAIYAASQSQQHRAVEQARWNERRADIAAQRAQWDAASSRDAAWAAYHQAHQAEEDAHWAEERSRRQAEAVRYAQGAPPPAPPPFSAGYGDGPPPRGDGGRFAQGGDGGAPFDPRRHGGPDDTVFRADQGRQAALQQDAADAQVQRQAAEQAHAAELAATRQQAQDARRQADERTYLQAMQAQQQRQAQEQAHAQADARRQADERTYLQAMQAQQQRQAQEQARAQADARRQADERTYLQAMQAQQQRQAQEQARGQAEAQRQAAEQAHAAQADAARRQAEGERQAQERGYLQAMQAQQQRQAEAQARGQAEVQRRAAEQAHAQQEAQGRAQEQARAAAEAQRHAADQPHPGPPRGDHEHDRHPS